MHPPARTGHPRRLGGCAPGVDHDDGCGAVAPIAYGASPSLTAQVAQAENNAKLGGTVAFSLDGTAVSAPVQAGKAKVDLPPAFTIGARTVTATFTPDVKNLAPSQATTSLSVVRDSTTTMAHAVYRDARRRLVGKARVVAAHEAAVAGAVRLVLKRDGVRIRVAKVGLNQFGKAKKVFETVTKPGHYTGSPPPRLTDVQAVGRPCRVTV